MPSSVPNIVASQSFTSQSSAIATTTLYTPAVPGLYRVSVYQDVNSGSSGAISFRVNWTDNAGAQMYGGSNIVIPIYSLASAITFSVSIFSGTPTYDFLITLEQLI